MYEARKTEVQFPSFPSGRLQKDYKSSCFFPTRSKTCSTVLCQLAKFQTKSLIFKTKEKQHSKPSLEFRFLSKPGVTTQHRASSNQEVAWCSPYTHRKITPQTRTIYFNMVTNRMKILCSKCNSFIAGPQTKIRASSAL